jgi:hypothetical protein
MSKIQEEKQEPKSNIKQIPSMSMRQQIRYLMEKTQNDDNWQESKEENQGELLDFNKYFFEKKQRIV